MHSFLWFLLLLNFITTFGQQYYDPSGCSSETILPGSRYICNNSSKVSCKTYLVYRANNFYSTISSIASLLQADSNELLQLNNLTSGSGPLEPAREVLIPITCSCSGRIFEAVFRYTSLENTTLQEVACTVFDGLVKSKTLAEENEFGDSIVKVGSKLLVPLSCACPDNFSSNSGVKYLVTYPLVEGDGPRTLSEKFSISEQDLTDANRFDPWQTIYPNTTVLIPLKTNYPFINLDLPYSPPPTPGFLPIETVERRGDAKIRRNLYIGGSIVVVFLVVSLLLLAYGLYIKVPNRRKVQNLPSFNTRSSSPFFCSPSPRSVQTNNSSTTTVCLSPDLLVGIKYSLKNLSMEELRKATKDFSEETRIGDQAYKAVIDNVELMVKQMRFEDTRQVIDIHSKINHVNIVNLLGVCYGESDHCSWSYLVFNLPSNGSLRNWLSNSSSPLMWHRRTQIAFDIATGLHYLHDCIFPCYAHMNVSTKNIFLTSKWRAKLTNIRVISAGGSFKRNDIVECVNGCVAPEYLLSGSASEKVDVFSFGIVLLELISGREDLQGNPLRDCIGFLGGGGASEGGCFEQLRGFMDPWLKEDYPLAEALCLSVLAKACLDNDPSHRPSMHDILKVLVRML